MIYSMNNNTGIIAINAVIMIGLFFLTIPTVRIAIAIAGGLQNIMSIIDSNTNIFILI